MAGQANTGEKRFLQSVNSAGEAPLKVDLNTSIEFRDLATQSNLDSHHDIIEALEQPVPSISPKYFYDELGSSLFTAICQTPEYYPTRTEAGIFETARHEIAQIVGTGRTLVDIGACDCAKAATWFDALKPAHYIGIDISTEFLRQSMQGLKNAHPEVRMTGLGLDFANHFALPAGMDKARRLMFYPGSSIGNFSPLDASRFIEEIRQELDDTGALLIGVDLVKDESVLVAAYDDSLGVTASFNLNVLNQINRLSGTNFDLTDWHHVALFNRTESRIEMHLQAVHDVLVTWPSGARQFVKGQRIHTENSYKYTTQGFSDLLVGSGFERVRCWTDPRQQFGVFLAQAR